jgi:hypothetical protein
MIVNSGFKDQVVSSTILMNEWGSDHCPQLLELKPQPLPTLPEGQIPLLSSRLLEKVTHLVVTEFTWCLQLFQNKSIKAMFQKQSAPTPKPDLVGSEGKEEMPSEAKEKTTESLQTQEAKQETLSTNGSKSTATTTTNPKSKKRSISPPAKDTSFSSNNNKSTLELNEAKKSKSSIHQYFKPIGTKDNK